MKRRRKRTVAAVTAGTIAAVIVIACATSVIHRANVQRDAVKKLRELGAVVSYDFQYPTPIPDSFRAQVDGSREWVKALSHKSIPDLATNRFTWFRSVFGPNCFNAVVSVNLAYYETPSENKSRLGRSFGASTDYHRIATVDHPHLESLKHFPKLRFLVFHQGQATNKTLSYLQDMRQLRVLLIWNAKIDDDALSALESLEELRQLHAGNSGLTDRALEHVGKLPRLEWLALQDNHFTDAGLVHLAALTNLKTLNLKRNMVEDIGPLITLVDLEVLNLEFNQITDISVLSNLTHLTHLDLSQNRIRDISALTSLWELKRLDLKDVFTLNSQAYSRHLPDIHGYNPGITLLYEPNPFQ